LAAVTILLFKVQVGLTVALRPQVWLISFTRSTPQKQMQPVTCLLQGFRPEAYRLSTQIIHTISFVYICPRWSRNDGFMAD